MNLLYLLDRSLVLSHVVAGTLGLLVAPLAMLTIKGGPAHRLWGKIFFWSMFWIFASTLGLMFFRFNFFLLIIAILSFYTALTGYRVLYLKRPQHGDAPLWLDWISSMVAALAGVGFAGWGVLGIVGVWGNIVPGAFFILGLVFGAGLLATAIPDLIRYVRPPTERNAWWYEHMNRMLSAYIAMVTAFMVQNVGRHLPADWQWVTWVLPGVIGTPLISLWIGHYRKKFTRAPAPAAAGAD